MSASVFDFPVDSAKATIDGRSMKECAAFLDKHGSGFTDWEAEFLESIMTGEDGAEYTARQVASMAKIYDERC